MKQLALLPASLPSLLAVALVAVLAGCGSAPTDTTTTPAGTETFEVEMTGNSSTTYRLEARLVADPPENLTITYANDSTRTIEIPDRNGANSYGPDSEVTAVEPGSEVVGGVYFEGSPNFSVTDHDVPPTRTAVYTVREKGEEVFVAWGIVRCNRHVSGLSLTVGHPENTGIGVACEG